jgi:hypothetical protein
VVAVKLAITFLDGDSAAMAADAAIIPPRATDHAKSLRRSNDSMAFLLKGRRGKLPFQRIIRTTRATGAGELIWAKENRGTPVRSRMPVVWEVAA